MPLTDNQKGHLREVKLNTWEIKFLEYIKDRGGEVDFRFERVTENCKNAIWALYYKQLITIERRTGLVEGHVSDIRLTDQGRAILSSLEDMRVGNG